MLWGYRSVSWGNLTRFLVNCVVLSLSVWILKKVWVLIESMIESVCPRGPYKPPAPCSTSEWCWCWCGTVGRWEGREDERGSERTKERASGGTGGRAGQQHRPGQEAARMEIRPDRFKAAAGKTLGKIHRYIDIFEKYLHLSLTFSAFLRVRRGQLRRVWYSPAGLTHPHRDF